MTILNNSNVEFLEVDFYFQINFSIYSNKKYN